MGELFRLFLQFIEFLWPLKRVEEWENGGFYRFGRWKKPVTPGVHWAWPWFEDVKTVSLAEAIVGTGRQDITLSDGTMLSFAATATVKVNNVYLALNTVDEYTETTQELLASVLAEKLAEVDAQRLTPEKRGRLFADLKRWVAEEAAAYGVEVRKVRFTSFITNARVHRLIVDPNKEISW